MTASCCMSARVVHWAYEARSHTAPQDSRLVMYHRTVLCTGLSYVRAHWVRPGGYVQPIFDLCTIPAWAYLLKMRKRCYVQVMYGVMYRVATIHWKTGT